MTAKLAELLEKCGIARINAVSFAYLLENRDTPVTAYQIERKTGLRQPQVSLAISYLKDRKWITVSEAVAKDKEKVAGRPEKMYQCIAPEKIFAEIAKMKEKDIKDIQDTLEKLRQAMTVPKPGGQEPASTEAPVV